MPLQGDTLVDTVSKQDTIEAATKDTLVLTISKNEEDLPVNDYLTNELKPIRQNFNKLNSITEWSFIDKRKLGMTPENGVAEYYYLDGQLQKIIAIYPQARKISEYYLLNGHLSFTILKSVLSEDEDEELITDKNYFKNNKLIHKTHSQDCGAPFAKDYLVEEEKNILDNYRKIKDRL